MNTRTYMQTHAHAARTNTPLTHSYVSDRSWSRTISKCGVCSVSPSETATSRSLGSSSWWTNWTRNHSVTVTSTLSRWRCRVYL